jgi:hypothetical protein
VRLFGDVARRIRSDEFLPSSLMHYTSIFQSIVLEHCHLKLEVRARFRTHIDALSLNTIRFASVRFGKRSSEFVVVLFANFRMCFLRSELPSERRS